MPSNQDSTTTLIQRVRGGDLEARDALLKRCLPIVQKWAHGRLPRFARTIAETDDLVQVTLIKAVDSIPNLKSTVGASFWAYVHRILLNKVRDEIRSHKAHPTELYDGVGENHLLNLPDAASYESELEFERTLAKLPQRQQALIVMRTEFGLSYSEIAAEVNSTPDAVRMMISRTIVEMARQLSDKSAE